MLKVADILFISTAAEISKFNHNLIKNYNDNIQ